VSRRNPARRLRFYGQALSGLNKGPFNKMVMILLLEPYYVGRFLGQTLLASNGKRM
jgi:hypothetical protein